MAKSFVRNLVLALGVFLVMAVLVYSNVEFAEPITEYVAFVVTADFSVQPFLQRVGLAEKWDSWDLGSLFEGWSEATLGGEVMVTILGSLSNLSFCLAPCLGKADQRSALNVLELKAIYLWPRCIGSTLQTSNCFPLGE